MAIRFQSVYLSSQNFNASSPGHIVAQGVAKFPTNCNAAEACIKSFDLSYSHGHWVHFASAAIQNVQINGATVTFEVDLGLADDTKNYISKDVSSITVLVIADCQ